MKRRLALCLFLALMVPLRAVAQEPVQRPARPNEVRAFCEAVRRAGETWVAGDGATDMESCLKSAMTVRKHAEGGEISGKWMWNYPAYSMPSTCHAIIRDGTIAPDTVDCRDRPEEPDRKSP